MTQIHPHTERNSQGEVVFDEAAVSEQAGPQLDTNDPENEEDKEAEQQHITQHGQRVQQQGHQYAHTCRGEARTGSNTPHTVQ